MGPIGQIGRIRRIRQIGRIRRIRQIGRIREIGSRAPPQPFFEGCKVRSPVFRSLESIWTEDGGSGGTGRAEPYRTRVGGRNLFPKTKSEGKGSKKRIYTNKKHSKTCICAFFGTHIKLLYFDLLPLVFNRGPFECYGRVLQTICEICCKFGLRLVTQFPRSYIRSILQMSIFFIKLCF